MCAAGIPMALVLRGSYLVARQTFLNSYGAGAIAPAIGPDLKFDVQRKRPATLQLIGGPDPKRLKLSDFTTKKRLRNMPRVRRRSSRRFSRRKRRFGRKRIGRRVTFAKKVKRVIFRTLERKLRVTLNTTTQTLAEGDGVTRVTYLHTPVLNMQHGDEEDRFEGNNFWLKGLLIRGQLTMDRTTPLATSALVRFTLMWSRIQGAGFDTGFTALGNTTTAVANPAQTAPDANPQFFMNTAVPFVGQGYVAPFDTTRHKVIKSFTIPVNPTSNTEAGVASMPTPFKCYVPIRRMIQVEDALQGPLGGPIRCKGGTYWWIVQCVATNDGTSADTVCALDCQCITYFRDP